jgi:cysteine desulfuration protein SufE
MTIEEIQDEIIEEFSVFDEWMDKYSYLIDLGKDLPQIADHYKTDDYVIKGCQSQVWLNADYSDGIITFSADSDAIITKGMVSLLVRVLSGQKPDDIIDADLHFIKEIGLDQHLSPTRANGLLAMVKKMKLFAMAYQAKESK